MFDNVIKKLIFALILVEIFMAFFYFLGLFAYQDNYENLEYERVYDDNYYSLLFDLKNKQKGKLYIEIKNIAFKYLYFRNNSYAVTARSVFLYNLNDEAFIECDDKRSMIKLKGEYAIASGVSYIDTNYNSNECLMLNLKIPKSVSINPFENISVSILIKGPELPNFLENYIIIPAYYLSLLFFSFSGGILFWSVSGLLMGCLVRFFYVFIKRR